MFGRKPKIPFRTDPKADFIAPVLDQDPKVFSRQVESRPEPAQPTRRASDAAVAAFSASGARPSSPTRSAPAGAAPDAPGPGLDPTQLSVLLHYCAGPDVAPFEPDGPESHALFFLEMEKLVEHLTIVEGQPTKYAITERGRIYIERVLAIPLPVAVTQWSFPDR